MFNKKKKLEEKINTYLKSMIEVCFEYVSFNEKEINAIYILGNLEEYISFLSFYQINNQIVSNHLVNEYLEKKCDTSSENQSSVQEIGSSDLDSLEEAFKEAKEQVPNRVYITYYPKTNKMSSEFDYEQRLIGTDLMDTDLRDRWIKELGDNFET